MRIDPAPFAIPNKALTKEPRFVVQIVFEVGSIYCTSHADISGVGGVVISESLMEPDFVSQTLKPDEAIAEIGSSNFKIFDKDGAFTDAVRDQLFDESEGLRKKRMRFYLGYKGLDFSAFVLVGTQEIRKATYDAGIYNVSCLDIQRSLKTEIFKPFETTLLESVSASQTTIPLVDASAFELVHHASGWSDAPNATVGYIKIKNEKIRYTGKDGDTLTGCTRGVFGTVPEAYMVDPTTEAERRERVTEYIYLELPAIKMALAILTGELYNEGETLPAHWHLAIDPALIAESDFTGIGSDLWTVADDTKGFPLRFTGLSGTDGKRFLEKEIYLLAGVFSPVYSDGRLGLKRLNRIIADATQSFTVNEDNALAVSALEHDLDDVRNVFEVQWSYDDSGPRRRTRFVDLDSRLTHGASDPLVLKFRGLSGGLHTDATIFQILDMNRERYSAPPLRISIDMLHLMNTLEVGDVGRVAFKNIEDFTAPGNYLDRSMELQRIRVNHKTGRVVGDFFGSSASASIRSPTAGANVSLLDSFYVAAGTALNTVSGLVFSGDTITSGTATLTGNADVNAAGAIYYHNGNLTIAPGVVVNLAANVQLRVKGFIQINGALNGVGGGLPGVVDDGRDLRTSMLPSLVYNSIPGNPGFLGTSRGYDGLFSLPSVSAGIGTRPAARSTGKFTSAPTLMLKYDGLNLNGIPSDLRGGGGPPGGRYSRYQGPPPEPVEARGGAGGAGGAGLVIICRGLAVGANGAVNLSGANGSPTDAITRDDIAAFPGFGGSGAPGACYVLLDGGSLSVPDFGNKFTARNGAVLVQGNPIPADNVRRSELPSQPVSAFNQPQDPVSNQNDLSIAALKIQYIPSEQIAVADNDSLPSAPTGLSATGVPLANELAVTVVGFDSVDTVEIFASLDNDRANAAKIYEGRATSFRHQLPAEATRYYWARTRGFLNTDGRRPASPFFPVSATAGVTATSLESGAGADGESLEVQYSSDGINFHDNFVTGDVFLRQRIGPGGIYTGAIRFVGEDGAAGAPGSTGNFVDIIFRRSATTPATPTGNSPSGWFDAPPSSDGNPCFVSTGEKTAAGELVGSWSAPTLLVQDGDDGLPGLQGPASFTWTGQTLNVTTTPNTITKVSGTTAFDASAYSVQGYSNGVFVTARSGDQTKQTQFGLSEAPSSNVDGNSIDFSWHQRIVSGSRVSRAMQGSTVLGNFATWTTETTFAIVYDGSTVIFYLDGIEHTRVNNVLNKRYFLDTSLNEVGAKLVDVGFGPSGTKGQQGLTGASAKALQLTSTAQAFGFTSAGIAQPSGQSITFTAQGQNLDNVVNFSTQPLVALTGSGNSRNLTVDNFGGNNSVAVTVSADGLSDTITVMRLTGGTPGATGAAAINAFLTNETHTLPANPDGVVSSFVTAVGLFKVFQGLNDVSASASFSVVSQMGCIGEINTADNTPIAGQPRGFYRVTALSAEVATLKLQASFASATVPKDFTVQRSRAGRPGDGTNLLKPDQWIVGSAGTQGSFIANQNTINENFIVLAGDGRPLDPFGTTSPLWECRPLNGANDGGWDDSSLAVDHAKTYRASVFFNFNKHTGFFYLGAGVINKTKQLITGALDANPYFTVLNLAGLTTTLQPNKWYLAVGIIHGSGYAGGSTQVAGIYDPTTGQKIIGATEFANVAGITSQTHRCYHFDDNDSTHRSWFSSPRFELLNGNEPSLTDIMGVINAVPWIARNNMRVGLRTFTKVRGANAWDSDVSSIQSYSTCHAQFRPAQTNADFMIGLNTDPLADQSFFSLDFAFYCRADGGVSIYENGSEVLNLNTTYTTQSMFAILYDGVNVVYKLNNVVRRTVATSNRVFFLDSSFHTVLATAADVIFGEGAREEVITTGLIDPIAVTEFIMQTTPPDLFNSRISAANTLSVPARGRAYVLKATASGTIASDDIADPTGQNRTAVTGARIIAFLSNGTQVRSSQMIGGGFVYELSITLNVPAGVSITVLVVYEDPPPSGQFFAPYFVTGVGSTLALQLVKA